MELPRKCGPALRLLLDHYKTEELVELHRRSGIAYQTLFNWREKPDATLREGGRQHLRRIMSGAPEPRPESQRETVASLAARVATLEQRLDALTRINHEQPHRIAKMVRKYKAGGH